MVRRFFRRAENRSPDGGLPLIHRQSSFCFPIKFFFLAWPPCHTSSLALPCPFQSSQSQRKERQRSTTTFSPPVLFQQGLIFFFPLQLTSFLQPTFQSTFYITLVFFVGLCLLFCTKTQTYPISCDFMSERQEMADCLIHIVNKYWWGSSRKWLVFNVRRLCWGVDWSLGLWSPGLVLQSLPGTFLVPTCLTI